MTRGDIYLVSLDPAEDHEQKGRRPVVIVSTNAFNHATRTPIVLPITHGGEFARRRGFAVELTGLRTTGIVRCDQPRALDLESRRAQKVESIGALIDEVLARLAAIFE